MVQPSIHLNGSDPQRLADLYLAAVHALDQALERLAAAAPHGRDYYPSGPTAFVGATGEHVARRQALQGVRDDLATLYEHCQEAANERQQRRNRQ